MHFTDFASTKRGQILTLKALTHQRSQHDKKGKEQGELV
jgi:hypothetical protein